MTTIIYAADVRLPTEKAHGRQIIKTCEALAEADVEVLLIVPKRKNVITTDVFEYYDSKPIFTVVYVSVPTLFRWGPFGYWLQSIIFSFHLWLALLKKRSTAIYTRDLLPALVAKLAGVRSVWEAHDARGGWLEHLVAHCVDRVVTISQGLKDFISQHDRISVDKIVVIPDAVDLDLFQSNKTKIICRQEIGVTGDGPLVVYAGHLYGWKGVDTLARAAELLPTHYRILVVGGTDHDISRFEKQYITIPQLTIVGRKDYREIPSYLKAADVLVLPNSGKEKISSTFTSPLKLFEYMASGTPIVASDLPSLREILDDNLAVFFKPDDPRSLALAIEALLGDKDLYAKIAECLPIAAKEYSWSKRAVKIANAVKI